MTIIVEDVALSQRFETTPSWWDLIGAQLTEATVNGADPVTLDLLYYIRERMSKTAKPGVQCVITLKQFQRREARQYGVKPSECAKAWNSFDWRHAISSSCE